MKYGYTDYFGEAINYLSKKLKVNIDELKNEGKKIVGITAYDYSTAKLIEEAGVDLILVGDSLAMVALGYRDTYIVGIDEMVVFVRAVSKGAKNSFVIGDMPFMSYNISVEQGLENATKMIKAGASAIKIEGANNHLLKLISRCTQCGIPVLGHLGFTPQFLNSIGGYKVQGKTYDSTVKLLEWANRLVDAGVFGIVLEMVPEESAKYITDNLSVPTIGIGAGRYCSGQILVADDILGKFTDFTPKFARKYANVNETMKAAISQYAHDVRSLNFPSDAEVFNLDESEYNKLKEDEYFVS